MNSTMRQGGAGGGTFLGKTRCVIMPAFKTNVAAVFNEKVSDLLDCFFQLRRQSHKVKVASRRKENCDWCAASHGGDVRKNSFIASANLFAKRLLDGETREAFFSSIAHGRCGPFPPLDRSARGTSSSKFGAFSGTSRDAFFFN